MKNFRAQINIGEETVNVVAHYRTTTAIRATSTDPESGGVELMFVELLWTDEAWVDSLLQQLHKELNDE